MQKDEDYKRLVESILVKLERRYQMCAERANVRKAIDLIRTADDKTINELIDKLEQNR